MNKLMRMAGMLLLLLIVVATFTLLGPIQARAAASSFKFSNAFTGIQAAVLAAVFNTSTGHYHDGTDSRQLTSSSLASASVNTAKLDVAAVTTVKIANGAVDSTKLAAPFLDIKTKAQFSAATPAVGQVALCSNCTAPYSLCIATGAVLGGWARVQTGTVDTTKIGCGTGE